jgi:Flp pilus assembly protein TadB
MTIALGVIAAVSLLYVLAALLLLYALHLRRQRNRLRDTNRQLTDQLDMYTAWFAVAVEQTLHLDGRGRHGD